MKARLTPKEKAELKAQQFNTKLDTMSDMLCRAGVLKADHQQIMTFYRWLCFDLALKSEFKESERVDGLVQRHLESFDMALSDGIKRVSKSQKEDIRAKALALLWGENSRT